MHLYADVPDLFEIWPPPQPQRSFLCRAEFWKSTSGKDSQSTETDSDSNSEELGGARVSSAGV